MSALATAAHVISRFNDTLGRGIAWLALAMVLVQFAIVVMRYVFGLGSIFMQESVVYMHGLMFMLGAAYTLRHDGHVRVDIFYRDASPRAKALVDLAGVCGLLVPVCVVILIYSVPYVRSSWAVFEGSKETSGIQGVFLLKSVIILFTVLLLLQGVAVAARAILTITGNAPAPDEKGAF